MFIEDKSTRDIDKARWEFATNLTGNKHIHFYLALKLTDYQSLCIQGWNSTISIHLADHCDMKVEYEEHRKTLLRLFGKNTANIDLTIPIYKRSNRITRAIYHSYRNYLSFVKAILIFVIRRTSLKTDYNMSFEYSNKYLQFWDDGIQISTHMFAKEYKHFYGAKKTPEQLKVIAEKTINFFFDTLFKTHNFYKDRQ